MGVGRRDGGGSCFDVSSMIGVVLAGEFEDVGIRDCIAPCEEIFTGDDVSP